MPAPPEDMYQTPPPPVDEQSWIPENYIEKGWFVDSVHRKLPLDVVMNMLAVVFFMEDIKN